MSFFRLSKFSKSALLTLSLTVSALLTLLPLSASAQQGSQSTPRAGTQISNRARVSFVDSFSNLPVTFESNAVTTQVQPLEALTLTPENSVRALPGARVEFAHRLTNTGNATSSYSLRIQPDANADLGFNSLAIFRDVNRNGALDSGEPAIGPDDDVLLEPGASLDLIVSGVVPLSAQPGTRARTFVQARSQLQNQVALTSDTAIVSEGFAPQLRKSVDRDSAQPNDTLAFTVRTSGAGTGQPRAIPVFVDGQSRQLIVLRDAIPRNTTFESLEVPSGAVALYHRAGDATQTYLTQVPTDRSQVDGIGVGLETFPVQPFDVTLRVRVGKTTNGAISNTASLFYADQQNSPQRGDSNTVTVGAPTTPPSLSYYQDATFSRIATAIQPGSPLFLEGVAAACNADSSVAERTVIRLTSQLTGDVEEFQAQETAPNSGVFRIVDLPTRDASNIIIAQNNGILEILPRDTLVARLNDCGVAEVTAQILVDPSGIVFDARTNEPIAGARVTLVTASGSPAVVFDENGQPTSSTVTTEADGAFVFPFVASGSYRLLVEPPPGYSFPSRLSRALLPQTRVINDEGSFGRAFSVGDGPVQLDVPLDPAASGLFAEKIAARRQVEIGDFLDYQVRVRNASGTGLTGAQLIDTLPGGFVYERNSVRVEGARISEPAARGPRVVFALPDIAPNTTITVSYRVRIGAGSRIGDAINRAQAVGTTVFGALQSNVASARVRVSGGVLTDRGILFGKVFLDLDGDRVQDKNEAGVPGVRVWVQDGTFAVSDTEGKYTLYGLAPRTHAVKLDRQTLPEGADLRPTNNRQAGAGDLTFADLTRAEFHKVNFALRASAANLPALQAEIALRRKNAARFEGETTDGDLTRTLNSPVEDIVSGRVTDSQRALPASGVVTGNGTVSGNGVGRGVINDDNRTSFGGEASLADRAASVANDLNRGTSGLDSGISSGTGTLGTPSSVGPSSFGVQGGRVKSRDASVPQRVRVGEENARAPLNSLNSNLPELPIRRAPLAPLEESLEEADNTLAFLDLRDNDVLPIDQANVRVKGALGAKLTLKLNGKVVADSRVGKTAQIIEKQLEAREYIGLSFKEGANTLELSQTDSFGVERGNVKITVIAPGALGRLRVVVPRGKLFADGRSPVPVRVLLEDSNGSPVGARTLVTLESSYGRFLVEDLNRTAPGVQVFIEGGARDINLLPPVEPTDAIVRVSSGALSSSLTLAFNAELRPLVALGILEGGLRFSRNREGSQSPSDVDNVPDEDFFRLGGSDSRARGSLFAKGRVSDNTLLTARYESRRDREARLFRDIRPDDFYPIYGDSSVKGFDAQSSRRFYARLDRDRSYALYGDYSTDVSSRARTLGAYNRALTGAKYHLENGRVSANFFASRENNTQVVDERRGQGISGPYLLSTARIEENSERVEIITRDRNNSGVILSVSPQSRFVDYELDYLTGRLLFRGPVSSLDGNLNPVFIRVTYEAEIGGERFLVAGLDAQYRVSRNLEIGGAFARDKAGALNASGTDSQNLSNRTLASFNATLRLGEGTYLTGEIARSRSGNGNGGGERLELLHESGRLQARVFAGKTDANFNNASSALSAGRSEISAKASYQADRQTRFTAEAIRTRDVTTGGTRQGAYAGVERAFNGGANLELGVRTARETGTSSQLTSLGSTPNSFTSLRARLTAPVPFLRRARGFAEYEQDLGDSSKRVIALGGDYQLTDRSRLYLRHEIASSLSGLYALNSEQEQQSTVFGIDTDFLRNGRLYSEYRVRNAISGREAVAAVGLRNQWNLRPGLRLQTSFERVTNIGGLGSSGATGATGTSATAAIEYTPRENFKATGRLELRGGGDAQKAVLGSFGLVYKPNDNLSLLARGLLNSASNNGGTNGGLQQRLQFGLAYRPTRADMWNALLRYEYRFDRDGSFGLSAPGVGTGGTFSSGVRGVRHLLSGDLNYQPTAKLRTALHLGAKWTRDRSQGLSNSGATILASGRITYDLNSRADVSLFAGTLNGGGSQYGLGAEIGYLLRRDLWLTLGYNFASYSDDDLVDELLRSRGPFVRLRWKFDENTFGLGRNPLPTPLRPTVAPEAAPDASNDAAPTTETPAVLTPASVPTSEVAPQRKAAPKTANAPASSDAPLSSAPLPPPLVPDVPTNPNGGTR